MNDLPLTAFGELNTAENTPVTGWTFAYNVNADLVTSTVTGSGTVTHSGSYAVLATTAAASSSAKIDTVIPLRYTPGQGARVDVVGYFTPGVAGSQQFLGIGDPAVDGFFFGYNGAAFGVCRVAGGVATWVTKANWSEHGAHPASWLQQLDPTKGNVYQIIYQWLGHGKILFKIENPATGMLETVHHIRYANTATATSVNNPTLPISAYVVNTTNETAITLKTSSAMGFVQGKVDNPPPDHPFALNRVLTAAGATITTEANLLTLSNPVEFQSVTNRIRAQLVYLSVGVDGTKNNTIRLTKNTTLGGTPSYAAYSANTSPITYDVAGTTLTGGTRLFSAVLQKIDSNIYDLSRLGIFLSPGETITVSAQSAVAVDVNIALGWVDLL
jgi:hypothetical protein